jgi:polyphosphate kinase
MPQSVRKLLMKNLDVAQRNVYEINGALGLSCLIDLLKIERPDLKDEPFVPKNRLEEKFSGDIFGAIKAKDQLLYLKWTPTGRQKVAEFKLVT